MFPEVCEHTRVLAQHPTGSAYTVNPPVMNTDQDWLVLVEDFNGAVEQLIAGGWELCCGKDDDGREMYKGDPNYSTTWYALRNGVFNVMLTADPTWYIRAVAATLVCKALNLKDKEERKQLFRSVRDEAEYTVGKFPTFG